MSGLSHSCELISLSELESFQFQQIIKLDREDFPLPWSEQQWVESRDKSTYLLFLSFLEGQICCYSLFLNNETEGLAHLLKVAVAHKARRQGVAMANLKESFKLLSHAKLSKVYLEVELSNTPAITLYERLNFLKLVVKKNFYGPDRDAAAMILEL